MRTSIEVIVEVEIRRPPPAVWAVLADAGRLSDWIGEFQAALQESEGPTGVGSVWRYTIEPGKRSGTLEIVEWDPPRRIAWDGPPLRWAGGGARPRGSHELAPTGEGTLLVSRYQPELIGTQALLRRYLKRWVRRQRLADAQTLKALLEGERSS